MKQQLEAMLQSLSVFDNQRLSEVGFWPFLLLLAISLMAALFISYLYLQFYSSRPTGSQVHRAFPLLGISITAIFICIQFSLPLSLGLLGALSIVRFRTPIKEPEEIGFIMLLIATSLASATFNLAFLVLILAVALVALLIRRFAPGILRGGSNDGSLIIALPEERYAEQSSELFSFLERQLPRAGVESVSKNQNEIVVAMNFKGIPPKGLVGFESELRKVVEPSDFTILYSRPGAL